MKNDNRRPHPRHYPRRYLTLRQGTGEPVEIRCVEESQANYFGHLLTGPAPEKFLRFQKSAWEVVSDKTK